MKRYLHYWVIFAAFIIGPLQAQPKAGYQFTEYQAIKKRLIKGWNTWNTRSVLSQVLLPEGFAVNLNFKQHNWLEEKYLKDALIGRYGKQAEQITPGIHTYTGSYTELTIQWQTLYARIQTAHVGDDLVILVTPLKPTKPLSKNKNKVALIVEAAMLWNRNGALRKNGNQLEAKFPSGKSTSVHITGNPHTDYYVPTYSPYLAVFLDQPVGISTGKQRSLAEIQQIVKEQKVQVQKEARQKYKELAEAFTAVQAGVAWNLIYEPKYDRVVSTVGRLWNAEYGGYCLFGWDNFFLSYVTSLSSRDLAFANVLEHLRGKTEEGFIPNDNRGNGSKSWDRSQPPVGAIMVKEIYKRYPEKWFLEATFDDLLGWNRWWFKKRLNEGLLSYGSHKAKNLFFEPATQSKRTAGYESGMDDSPMYIGVPFSQQKNTLELQDVGLNSLVIADCRALIEMAQVLGRKTAVKELTKRANLLEQNLEKLWDKKVGFYLNYRTDLKQASKRLSPTLFYPLLAKLPSKKRAKRIVEEHFFNPEEFAGEWILPSIARNDPTFSRQRYWKGAIWPPLNFLTYLSLRQYGFTKAHQELSQKSLKLILNEWKRKGYVSENYSAITGTGDDRRLSSDKFHSWGTLFGIMAFIEQGYLPKPEAKTPQPKKK
ncbi:hypothetical protein BKI52_22790 [marine bacterium AO1-C]|nr:hypothetical protein BKI52_22790 [marine bacterium AO1-C]